jgi:hypothetical protein
LRLKERHERRAEAPDLALVLLRRLGQLPIRIYRSWLSFHNRFDSNFALSLVGVRAAAQVERSMVEQIFIYSLTRSAERYASPHDPARSIVPGSRVARHRPLSRPVAPFARPTMLLATRERLQLATRERLQLSTLIHWQRSVRRETEVTNLSRRLAERVGRLPEAPPPLAPMALRREPPAVRRLAAFEETSGPTRWQDPPNRLPPAPPAAVSPVNIDQLTAQVLKQIDRRVVARRERLGQV